VTEQKAPAFAGLPNQSILSSRKYTAKNENYCVQLHFSTPTQVVTLFGLNQGI